MLKYFNLKEVFIAYVSLGLFLTAITIVFVVAGISPVEFNQKDYTGVIGGLITLISGGFFSSMFAILIYISLNFGVFVYNTFRSIVKRIG